MTIRNVALIAVAAVSLMATFAVPARPQGNLTDPYAVLEKRYAATGGLERMMAIKTSYTEGTIDIVGTGLKGTFKNWEAPPLRKRQEVDLNLFKQTSGDNGAVAWVVDPNGKLNFQRDEETLKRRTIDSLLSLHEELNRNSKVFTLSLDSMTKVGDIECYVVRIANNINNDIRFEYVNAATFYPVETVTKQPDQETRVFYSDFREVDGTMQAFHQDIETLPVEQKQVVQITKYEPNVPIDSTLFEPPSQDVEDFVFRNGGDSVTMKFQYIENHIYVYVNVGGKERLWVLDSGAGRTVIDSVFAVELGLNPEGNLTGQGAGTTVNVSFVTLPPYRVGDIEFHQQKIVSINLQSLFRKVMGLDVVGILGYDFLSRFATRVDYANKTLTFYLPEKYEYAGKGKLLDAPLKENFFAVPMTVDGKYSGLWNLDLGAGSTSFHFPYAQSHGLLDRPGISRIGFGAGGSMEDRLSRFDSLDFFGFVILRPVIDLPVQKGLGAFSQAELVGNIGNDVFEQFVLYLDYNRQQVAVERGADFGVRPPRDHSGIQLWYGDTDSVEVFFVAPNTPGAKAGIQKGDQLVSINGIPVGLFDGMIAIRKIFREKPGTQLALTMVRNGKSMEFAVKLADYI